MKIITLTPVKNEERYIHSFLENASKFSDYIIIADQNSSDKTREIALTFPKVTIIDNKEENHSNKVRWQLLDKAREIPGNNMMVALDVDEMISPVWFEQIKKNYSESFEPIYFSFPWIQLWKGFENFRCDGVWRDSQKTAVWIDDKKIDYDRNFVINDHTNRVPGNSSSPLLQEIPILHFQFIDIESTNYKQAWYRMIEFIENGNARKINYKYLNSKDDKNVILDKVNPNWFSGISLPSSINELNSWHRTEIIRLLKKHGIKYFESLDIWFIKELEEMFVSEIGRLPIVKNYPQTLIKLHKFYAKLITS